MTSDPQPGRAILTVTPGSVLESLKTREEGLTFWINTYNALVAEGIGAFGIRRSVWEVEDFFGRISHRAGTLVFSADEIEHGVLRGNRPHPLSGAVSFQVGDPRQRYAINPPDARIHFAISCGARSCPAVRSYHPAGLSEQLDAATRIFVNQEVVQNGTALIVSELFKWFRADFDDLPGGLAGLLARYLEDGPVRQAVLKEGVAHIAWRPYDWRLALPTPPDARQGESWTVPA
ncbi:MAG: DUF547 domain-containing protein [Anaerolineae bacterium]